MSMRTTFYIVIVALIALAVFFGWRATRVPVVPSQNAKQIDIRNSPFFATDLRSHGITVDELGYHDFTPDGKYFVFTGVTHGDAIPSKAYIVNVKTGDIKLLPGQLLGDVSDSRMLSLLSGTRLVLYDIATGIETPITTDGNTFSGTLSPDGTAYVFDTPKGIREFILATKELHPVSDSQYDGANAWFSDSVHMLGYKVTGENLFEAGKGRTVGIWNIVEKTFQPILSGKINQKTIRYLSWIVPEHIARVNAGWDDGSFDYLADLDTETVLSLGDTSGLLMGGMASDARRGLFAMVGGHQQGTAEVYAELYHGMDRRHRIPLDASYIREGAVIIDEDTLLYIRKHVDAQETIDAQELVELDMNTGKENALQAISVKEYAHVSVSPDHRVWVLSENKIFTTGRLQ
jgi:WD40 repeat protein